MLEKNLLGDVNKMADDIGFETYNDMCTECSEHDTCHKNGIDYKKVEKCFKEIELFLEDQES